MYLQSLPAARSLIKPTRATRWVAPTAALLLLMTSVVSAQARLPATHALSRRSHASAHRHINVHAKDNIVESLQKQGSCRIFLSALKQADLLNTLTGHGPYTIFAPDDAAFWRQPKGLMDKLMQDKKKLRFVLLYHVAPGRLSPSDIKFGSVQTLSKEYLMTNVNPSNNIEVDGALVKKSNISCGNGVIYIIDDFLTPRTGAENVAVNAPTFGGATVAVAPEPVSTTSFDK